MEKYDFDKNQIDDEGIDYLGCSNWLKLHTIDLSKYYVTLGNTKVSNFGFMNLSKLSVKELKRGNSGKTPKIIIKIMKIIIFKWLIVISYLLRTSFNDKKFIYL